MPPTMGWVIRDQVAPGVSSLATIGIAETEPSGPMTFLKRYRIVSKVEPSVVTVKVNAFVIVIS